MSRIISTTVYTLDELSDAAREKARNWYREHALNDDWLGMCEAGVEQAYRAGLNSVRWFMAEAWAAASLTRARPRDSMRSLKSVGEVMREILVFSGLIGFYAGGRSPARLTALTAFAEIKRKRVDAGHDIAQRLMYQPVPGDAAETREARTCHADSEMRLAALAPAAMAAMAFALVDDLQLRRRQAVQFFPHFVGNHQRAPLSCPVK